MNIVSTKHIKKVVDKTDWDCVRALTEEEIVAAANSDPDAPLTTPVEAKRFKRRYPKVA